MFSNIILWNSEEVLSFETVFRKQAWKSTVTWRPCGTGPGSSPSVQTGAHRSRRLPGGDVAFPPGAQPTQSLALCRSDTNFQVKAEQNSEKAGWRTHPSRGWRIRPSRGRCPAGFAVDSHPWVFLAHRYRTSALSVRSLSVGPFRPHRHSQWGKV